MRERDIACGEKRENEYGHGKLYDKVYLIFCCTHSAILLFFIIYFLVTSNTRIFGQSEQLHRNTDDALKEHNANHFFVFAISTVHRTDGKKTQYNTLSGMPE